MTFFNETKRSGSERDRKRKDDTMNRRRSTDSNRDGDSQRNRSDNDLFGGEEF